MASSFHAGAVFGNYELVRPLGSGGMGVVYEAQHRSLGRRAAIKLLHAPPVVVPGAEQAAADQARARFMREGRAAAQVRHPHVVEALDAGVENGIPFLVMELVKGETLADLLARDAVLPVARAMELVLPIVSAVAELHAAGVIHRDLKPANVLIARGPDGEPWPKVADFGVSRMDDSPGLTGSGVVLGTLEYLSPEQARDSREATPQTDQYALGVILYQCVTGALPFGGAALYDTLHAIVKGPLVKPSTLQRAIPPPLDAVILRAMKRDPDARFACMEDLGAALLPFASPEVAARWSGEFLTPSRRVPLPRSAVSRRATLAASPSLRARVGVVGAAAVIGATLLLAATAKLPSGGAVSQGAVQASMSSSAPSPVAPLEVAPMPTAPSDVAPAPVAPPPLVAPSPARSAPAPPRKGRRQSPQQRPSPAEDASRASAEGGDNGAPILDP